MLDFVDTPKRQVVFTPLGQRFVRAGMEERKDLWQQQLMELGLFRVVKDLLGLHDGALSKEETHPRAGAAPAHGEP